MAIEFANLLLQKVRKFGASETSVDFQQKALDSFNYCLDDLENEAGVATTRITNVTDSVDLDSQAYEGTISLGIDYYLSMYAEYRVESRSELKEAYQRKLATARRTFLSTEDVYGPRGDMST